METIKIHNLIIVDASGSMSSIYNQTLSGINETIATIKNASEKDNRTEQFITLLTFSNNEDKLDYIYRNTPIGMARMITKDDYELRGMTALYDAIGDSVSMLREVVEKEDKVLVTIITDGLENDSRCWTKRQVKNLVDELDSKGWIFTYIGANQDAIVEAKKIGVTNSLNFDATEKGTAEMFAHENECRMACYSCMSDEDNSSRREFFKKRK